MSSTSEPTTDEEYTTWGDVTPAQKRVAKTIAHVHGPSTFERPSLRDAVEDSSTAVEVIDDKDRVLTSLKYTTLLNKLVEEGYLVKEHQGGQNPIVLDLEYVESRDTVDVAPFGNTSKLHTLVNQVCDREGITRDLLSEVSNPYDFNEVKDKVNSVVGRTVLQPYSEPSRYRFTKETYGLVSEKAEEFRRKHS